jgi:hypothetical protein
LSGVCSSIFETPMKIKLFSILAVLGLGTLVQAKADDIQFVTLPQVVRTTVVRETHIPNYSRVTRVIRDMNGVYQVTVRRDSDNAILYVDPTGRLVNEQYVAFDGSVPVATTATAQPAQQVVVTESSSAPTVDTFVRSLDAARYQLIEKKGNKEVYLDRATGARWQVKVERLED